MSHCPADSHLQEPQPRLIAWEVTRSCMLACKHCRAAAQPTPYEDEFTTEECFKLLDNIASVAKPTIILTGGEPMLRPDIYDIAAHACSLDLPVVMAPCGMLIDDESAAKIARCGIRAISISLDGATAQSHDSFRGVEGAFDGSLRGIEAAKRAGLAFQINTTVTEHNLEELPRIMALAVKLGASVFNPFLLVPTGRGKQLADQELTPAQYEQTLHWLAGQQGRDDIYIRVTCAPHYQRILRQLHVPLGPRPAKGCMGGQSFAFISHRGIVQICGFLDIECGDIRRENYDFHKIWRTSEVFARTRDLDSYHGRCGYCQFRKVCGGCRARAYAITGDYLDEEPFCTYQPAGKAPTAETDTLSDFDKRILSVIQTDFPVVERPFDVLAERLCAEDGQVMARIARMREVGVIRRLGAVFDSRRLGYASTLVAARTPPERLDEVADTVNQLPGVTHNYRREHHYNLWFTLTAQSQERLEAILEDLRHRTPIAEFHSLPALTVYKIRVNFQLAQDVQPADVAAPPPSSQPPAALDEEQKQLVRLLQDDLPLTPQPFAELAERMGWPTDRVLAEIADWIGCGIIRRFGAVVRHQRLGFSANGMAVFRAGPERIDELGRSLAEHSQVSHCYRRPPLEEFNYSLYAMVHGQDTEQVRHFVETFATDNGIGDDDYTVLFSTREYKKVSMKYFLQADGPGTPARHFTKTGAGKERRGRHSRF